MGVPRHQQGEIIRVQELQRELDAEVLSKVKAGRGRTHGKLEGVVWRRLLTGTASHREIPVAAVRQAEWIRVEGRENHAVWYMVEAVSDQLRSELHE